MKIRRSTACRSLIAVVGCCLLGEVLCPPPALAAPRVSTAYLRPHDEAAASLRDYVRTHPQQYNDLRGIMVPVVAQNPRRPSAAPGQRPDAGGFQVVQQVLRVGEDG